MTADPQKSSHGPSVWLFVGVGIVLLIILGLAGWFGPQLVEQRRFRTEKQRIEAIVDRWQSAPPGANATRWQAEWETAYNAIGNVCFSPSHVSLAEMRRLRQDIELRNREPLTEATLGWLWRRLASTGPHGSKYIERMQPMWDEAAAANGQP